MKKFLKRHKSAGSRRSSLLQDNIRLSSSSLSSDNTNPSSAALYKSSTNNAAETTHTRILKLSAHDHSDPSDNDARSLLSVSSQSSMGSAPLSESATLFNTNKERLELQLTFNQNFDLYLPFLLRRIRQENSIYSNQSASISQETVASNKHRYSVLQTPTERFNVKRVFPVINELFRNTVLVFPSNESFDDFRKSRNTKKDSFTADDVALLHERGRALPFLKMDTHSYLRLEDGGADITFHKIDRDYNKPAKFCLVYVKNHTSLKRYCFKFTPQNEPPFSVLLFHHNFKPIADFNYRQTRFRVHGNSLIHFGVAPNLKLLVLDKEMHSMCDKVVDRRLFSFLLMVRGRRKSSTSSSIRRLSLPGTVSGNVLADKGPDPANDPFQMANPLPEDSNPIIKLNHQLYHAAYGSYVSNNLPPFACCQDAICYKSEYSMFPKRFKEQGKFECYQAVTNSGSRYPGSPVMSPGPSSYNGNSTLDVDLDTMVLTCINLSLRDIVNRRNSKVNSNIEMTNGNNRILGGGGVYASAGLLGGF